MVRQAGSESRQAGVKPGRTSKREIRKSRSTGKTRQTGNRQTGNTGINTQGLMGKTGDTWRCVETITKTGETDQGVTGIGYDSLKKCVWANTAPISARYPFLMLSLYEGVGQPWNSL